MAKEKAKLVQSKSKFKVIGKVAGIDQQGAYKEEEQTKEGNRQGQTYRSIRFGVKTSDTNRINVTRFEYEPTEVFMWNSELRKKDENFKGKKIPFGTWEETEDDLREDGWAVIQSRIGFDLDDKGKLITRGLPHYVAIQEIYENLTNDDSVVIEGEIRYSRWTNQQGQEVEQKQYVIERCFKIKDIDFEDEKFEEVSYFEQDIVYLGIDIDKKESVAYLSGRIIDFKEDWHDTTMVIRWVDENGETDKGMVKMVSTIKDKVKFGDVLTLHGETWNKALKTEVESDEDDDDDLFKDFGGKQKPKHAETYTVTNYINEMQVNGVEGWDKAVYTEDDFVKDELVEDDSNEFGGKNKKSSNPFEVDDDEEDEDDLPF